MNVKNKIIYINISMELIKDNQPVIFIFTAMILLINVYYTYKYIQRTKHLEEDISYAISDLKTLVGQVRYLEHICNTKSE